MLPRVYTIRREKFTPTGRVNNSWLDILRAVNCSAGKDSAI